MFTVQEYLGIRTAKCDRMSISDIGCLHHKLYLWSGLIDDVRIYDRAIEP